MSERIYLLGYMGSGKSTLGRRLAAKLDWEFIDLDQFIEDQQGKTVSEIFSQSGEPVFRAIESEALKLVSDRMNVVISLGGGTPCFNDNMSLINDSGTSVYIELTPQLLASRLKDAKQQRPLLADKTDEELLSFIASQLNERARYYAQAQFTIEGKGVTADAVIKRIS